MKESAGKPGTEVVDEIGEASSASHWKFFLNISFQEQCSYVIIFKINVESDRKFKTEMARKDKFEICGDKIGQRGLSLHIISGQPGIYAAPHFLYFVTRTSGQKTLVVLVFMIAWSMIDKEYGKKEYL